MPLNVIPLVQVLKRLFNSTTNAMEIRFYHVSGLAACRFRYNS